MPREAKMSKSADFALKNVLAEYHASTRALNIRERMDVLREIGVFVAHEKENERRLWETASWWGTDPMGGQG